ncbi:MAG TPA: hypothetical protein VFT90_04785 [Chryseosolibacter sp.]|nr:hypothetical protein [Chryseosolibacter sp.]
MQLLYIREQAQIANFLSGMHADAIMPNSNFEVDGITENSDVTVICSGDYEHYAGTIISIDSGYLSHPSGKWLDLKFRVQRNDSIARAPMMSKSGPRQAEA